MSSKSHEDVDDDDDDDSNDTDESDEVVTNFPTDIPVTFPPFTRGDNVGRGDSVAYRVRAKATMLKSSKLRKAAKKVNSADQWYLGFWESVVTLKMDVLFFGSHF